MGTSNTYLITGSVCRHSAEASTIIVCSMPSEAARREFELHLHKLGFEERQFNFLVFPGG